MKEDIVNLKQGQKTAGVDISRKVGPPPPPAPATPPVGQAPGPSQQFKMPSVSLGQTQKAPSLPQAKAPTPPSVRGPAPTPQKTQIYAPPRPAGGFPGDRKRLFMIIAGAVVLFGVLYWFLVLRVPEPEIVLETPTPTLTPTPTAKSIFQLIPSSTQITISSTEDFSTALGNKIKSLTPASNSFVVLEVFDENGNKYTLSDFVARVPIPGLLDSLYPGDAAFLLYGQKEMFDDKGLLDLSPTPKAKIALIAKSISSSSTRSALDTWEITMTDGLKTLFGIDPKKASAPTFLDNTYNGTNIRYRNFTYADSSIDYAILNMPESNSSYFIMTNSREAMYAAIDILKGSQ